VDAWWNLKVGPCDLMGGHMSPSGRGRHSVDSHISGIREVRA
jgi:hypothetical protein